MSSKIKMMPKYGVEVQSKDTNPLESFNHSNRLYLARYYLRPKVNEMPIAEWIILIDTPME